MAVLLVCAVVAVAVIAMDHKLTAWNELPFNGFGSIEPVVKKTATLPVRYRVLLPWVYWLIFWMLGGEDDPPERRPIYLFLKWGLAFLSLSVATYFFSPVVALALVIGWLLTLQYDYWSCYAEPLAFLLVLTGNVPLAVIGVIIGTLTKQTAIFLPFVFLSVGGGWWSVLLAGVYSVTDFITKRYQGKGERSNTVRKPMNVAFHYIWDKEPEWRYWLLFGWGLVAMTFVSVAHFQYMPSPFMETAWVPMAVCCAAFFRALIHEPRVMVLNVLWIGSLMA